jgi:hypothetical protein
MAVLAANTAAVAAFAVNRRMVCEKCATLVRKLQGWHEGVQWLIISSSTFMVFSTLTSNGSTARPGGLVLVCVPYGPVEP